MSGNIVYVDSSALAKRYVLERGTEALDGLYHRAEAGRVDLALSLWNIGEVAGALARALRAEGGTEEVVRETLWSFLRETRKMRLLGALRVVPVRGDLLAEGIPLLLRHDLTQPEALQIVTCRDVAADVLLTADRKLLLASRDEGIKALDPIADREEIGDL